MTSWVFWLWIIIALLVGAVVGFFIAQRQLKNYLQKNPPINEDVVRTMMMQMGRTPSQKQINQVMKQINQNMK
ncbi:MAG: YneF family protein [Turicibacter sp.]|nr:YneF family protein [Turicibacter sp.]